ncbi:hypothetical protein [Bradyrhizobium valentinum]|uniref:DUF4431 domain-containing protein n=1 Tax=Bradyrhizobium valentinum TaxID=1518501 RepID=A0A0R3L2D1_9BRAD|nr:hypothetical protein [Bradyrhizobium valentinum]KRR00047.1 hypothetical protein CQ10_24320 [Bradyrhizobium valentinum]KRR02124.1 hypothetical protein CP49_04935 [Bradyrhizobium valentinum]
MTKDRFAMGFALALILMASFPGAAGAEEPAYAGLNGGAPINTGDVLSGELYAFRIRDAKHGKKVAYHIISAPRRLPEPHALCKLETGPVMFELLTTGEAHARQLKPLVGKRISVKVDEIACADAEQMSEAVIKKWSLVKQR